MRTTLDIDDDVIAAARELARDEGTSIGAVVSDLARRGLMPARVERQHGRPVIRPPAGAPPITPEMVRRALDEDWSHMALLDVNALVALAWDAHVHHEAIAAWFDERAAPWATCPVSEAGFVRISSNPKVIVGALGIDEARGVLRELREIGDHRFLRNDISMTDADMPRIVGHRRVTDALLLTVARRAGMPLVTFDAAIAALAGGDGVELLRR